MCVKSFTLVTEDMGEVEAWKVFEQWEKDEVFTWCMGKHRRRYGYPINEWMNEADDRRPCFRNDETTELGRPFGFMAFKEKDHADVFLKHNTDAGVLRKVKLRGIRAIGTEEVHEYGPTSSKASLFPCYIAREMLILPEEA